VTYSPNNPKRWTFGLAATAYRDAVEQSLIFVLVGATIVSVSLCAYVAYGSGLDVEAA